jgi:hypothetical protein
MGLVGACDIAVATTGTQRHDVLPAASPGRLGSLTGFFAGA